MSNIRSPRGIRRWLVYLGAAVLMWAGAEFVFDFFPEEKKEFRKQVRTKVQRTFPEHAAAVAKSYGLTRYREQYAKTAIRDPAAPSVVLIHGLDDPGKVWMNLAPALMAEGMQVLEMRYPNDQPIVESAWLFYQELRYLRQIGVLRITIVAHSMGGLVSREMLTNPQIAYVDKSLTNEVPRATGLIMVGTPNHGSQVARFRVFGEVRDQWVHMLKGQGHLLRGILDGAGEAKIDLLPRSQFLRTLNERPHPKGVQMLVIAGIASPWNEDDVHRFIDFARDRSPTADGKTLRNLEAFLKSMSDGLGDGLVTVESTRLDGVDHRTVRGTHLSMIRNVTENSPRIPPAVPLVVDALRQMFAKR